MRNSVLYLMLILLSNQAAAQAHKNLILILADDLGWADTTLYGKTSLYETPNIERLAARGMTFTNAYASPICSPTRASIMSGQNPARHGMTSPAAHLSVERYEAVASSSGPPQQKSTNVRSATRLNPNIPLLSRLLHGAGYATSHFGKWHLGREPHSPLQSGFDIDLPHWWGPGPKIGYLAPWGYANPDFREGLPGEHIEDRMADEAVRWIKERDQSRPFFMNYWQFSVHAPFGAKPELVDRYRKKLGGSVDQLANKQVRDRLLSAHEPGVALPQTSPTYAAMVQSLDDAVGEILDVLDEEGIANDTIIVFYSDNGGNIHCGLEETSWSGKKYITPITSNHPLRGGKGGIHEGGVRVPAVVVWPDVTDQDSKSKTRIQATDLYPTILEMLELQLPKNHPIDGVDFTEALRGNEMQRGPMFTYVPGHGGTPHWLPPSMSVHLGDWKLIRTFHYGAGGEHDFHLYNLRDDIGESKNLATKLPEKVAELDHLIEDYLRAAQVVVPQQNPNFDPREFDPLTIGVQPGGLKMPPNFQASQKRNPVKSNAKPDSPSIIRGWTLRNVEGITDEQPLVIRPKSRNAFIANSKINLSGEIEFQIRIQSQEGGEASLQWRTEDQLSFPKEGQTKSLNILPGMWQNLSVSLDEIQRLVHLRLIFRDQKHPIKIEWIELTATQGPNQKEKRWDFQLKTDR